ncbi:transcription factor bHLH149-like [Gastrolobium bilobum]|uniref:transcription factor bHLH149-like n=1 Tax=Gastrolobium bilobum TaxID=150636 RepID=UPI002AB2DB25|nr:transcription factor bHLH149-like [Gastrolobium bilobum]
MASLQPNVDSSNSDTLQESNRMKRRKIIDHNSLSLIPWRSEAEQRIYSSKLVDTLRRSHPPPSKSIAVREVREAADRVLAATAKGRTRWSRAILASPLQLQRQHKKVKKAANGFMKKRTPDIWRRLPAVQKKARVLSRLVPGCRKASLPNLLEEVTDYISALEMQVRAMTALTELLDGGAPPPTQLGSA